MNRNEFEEYMKDNAETVIELLDVAMHHVGLEEIFKVCEDNGKIQTIEAIKFIIENKVNTNNYAMI